MSWTASATTDTRHTHIPTPERSAHVPVMQSPFAQHTRLRSVIHPSLYVVHCKYVVNWRSPELFPIRPCAQPFLLSRWTDKHFTFWLSSGRQILRYTILPFFCIHGVGFPCCHMLDTIVCAIYHTWLILSPLML
jgi:hypothetical protein